MRLPDAPPQQLKKASEQDWPPHSLLVYSSTPATIAVLVYSSTVPYQCCVQNTHYNGDRFMAHIAGWFAFEKLNSGTLGLLCTLYTKVNTV